MRIAIVRHSLVLLAITVATACSASAGAPNAAPRPTTAGSSARSESPDGPTGAVTVAFAGDVHFELYLNALLEDGSPGLGPLARALAGADVAMVNLESAITERGTPDPKLLESPGDRYWFRTSPAALDFLADAGVDVASVANNHGADYGPVGLADTLRAAAGAPVAVVGVGRDREDAFSPYRVSVRGTDLAFLSADASQREGSSSVWAAGPHSPGIAAARESRPRDLLAAVRKVDQDADLVVVYLHWGREGQACPTSMQLAAARALSEAGADVIVGSHAHVLLGSGWMDDTYVSYGLGNFLWYHNREPATGVLRLRIEDGEVVDDAWVPAEIQPWGRPMPLFGAARDRAVLEWRQLRGCAGLSPAPSVPRVAGFEGSVHRIGPTLRERMKASHGDRCPMAWRDLRLLRLTHVGFDGLDHTGELVVAATYARPVVGVFEKLYNASWPIRRMRTVDAYDGSDVRSMAANNTSGYNCRRVRDSDAWSAHAYGAAIDINPRQNPYLTGASVQPPSGRRFAAMDRSPNADVPEGGISADDVVVSAFAGIGWEWGGSWAIPDYQHFVGQDRR